MRWVRLRAGNAAVRRDAAPQPHEHHPQQPSPAVSRAAPRRDRMPPQTPPQSAAIATVFGAPVSRRVPLRAAQRLHKRPNRPRYQPSASSSARPTTALPSGDGPANLSTRPKSALPHGAGPRRRRRQLRRTRHPPAPSAPKGTPTPPPPTKNPGRRSDRGLNPPNPNPCLRPRRLRRVRLSDDLRVLVVRLSPRGRLRRLGCTRCTLRRRP